MQRRILWNISLRASTLQPIQHTPSCFGSYWAGDGEALYADIPKPSLPRTRKPFPTSMKVLIRRAKEEKIARRENPCWILEPPDNGLLVPELIEVAHQVNRARVTLLDGMSKLVNVVVPVNRCRLCHEVHIGHVGHEIRTCLGPKSGSRSAKHVWKKGKVEDVVHLPYCFHLHDRVGMPRVGHKERSQVQRLPAILELCIQAGLDLKDYPTVRRTKPVYSIEGRIIDFEPLVEGQQIATTNSTIQFTDLENETKFSSGEVATKTMESWFRMREGAKLMMEKYSVKTCGYCPEVQVGPKGHKVRMCRASKHQSRKGLHAWQEATIDDLIGPNHVWHVQDPQGPALTNQLKRYYGKAPAIIELCVQAGAQVPKEYLSMMRLDVIPPALDEVDLVA